MSSGLDIQKQLLGHISRRGSATVPELAEKIKIRPHIVRYQLSRLLAMGTLKRTFIIDQRTLGYHNFRLFFDLSPEGKQTAIETLLHSQRVAWLWANSGFRGFEMSVVAEHSGQILELINECGATKQSSLRGVVSIIEEDGYDWGIRHFMQSPQSVRPNEYMRTPHYSADQLDLRILRACRSCEDTSPSVIARNIGEPKSTVTDRLTKMLKAKVISEDMYVIVQNQGDSQQTHALISFTEQSKAERFRFLDFCQRARQVSAAYLCVGSFDYRLVLYGRTAEDIFDFEDEFKRAFADCGPTFVSMFRRNLLKMAAGV